MRYSVQTLARAYELHVCTDCTWEELSRVFGGTKDTLEQAVRRCKRFGVPSASILELDILKALELSTCALSTKVVQHAVHELTRKNHSTSNVHRALNKLYKQGRVNKLGTSPLTWEEQRNEPRRA